MVSTQIHICFLLVLSLVALGKLHLFLASRDFMLESYATKNKRNDLILELLRTLTGLTNC